MVLLSADVDRVICPKCGEVASSASVSPGSSTSFMCPSGHWWDSGVRVTPHVDALLEIARSETGPERRRILTEFMLLGMRAADEADARKKIDHLANIMSAGIVEDTPRLRADLYRAAYGEPDGPPRIEPRTGWTTGDPQLAGLDDPTGDDVARDATATTGGKNLDTIIAECVAPK